MFARISRGGKGSDQPSLAQDAPPDRRESSGRDLLAAVEIVDAQLVSLPKE